MTSRRTFLKSVALSQPLLLGFSARAAAGPASGRIALVVGNNAYSQAPLLNPVGDARAMAALFGKAGFAVDLVLDAREADLAAAFQRFVALARQSDIREAVFYYAGHGAQLDWRNYLMPVDAVINSADDLKTRCLDLNQALAQLPAGDNKTFLFILDACRNNPFGKRYQTVQSGLSQFDAPPGTLLAYATGPGRVASDGAGAHGLYTEQLIAELATPGVPIEESLKRVRLNVRLASQGAQIPWESTSLESSVVLFQSDKRLTAEVSPLLQIEEEIEHWNRIQTSRQADDWIAYLRRYPNGKFAEMAQFRLDALLVPAPVTPSPSRMPPSVNPYSAGRYSLGRHYTVGDRASYRVVNLQTRDSAGVERHWTVTHVDRDAQRVELNKGAFIWDLMGNPVQPGKNKKFDAPAQYYPSELYVGKKWTSLVHSTDLEGDVTDIHLDFSVVAREKITVPAGEFDCFRLEGKGSNSKNVRLTHSYWVAPGINFFVRREILRQKNGRTWNRYELSALKQQR